MSDDASRQPEDDAPPAARVIRRIGMGPRRVIGIFHATEPGGRIAAIDKRTDRDWAVAPGDRAGAREGELVEAEQIGPPRAHGLPPHAYLLQLRLGHAKRLLAAGEAPAAVAAAVGFVDQSHLSRRFKGAFGITPGQYARACAAGAGSC